MKILVLGFGAQLNLILKNCSSNPTSNGRFEIDDAEKVYLPNFMHQASVFMKILILGFGPQLNLILKNCNYNSKSNVRFEISEDEKVYPPTLMHLALVFIKILVFRTYPQIFRLTLCICRKFLSTSF